jgi:hypothetical protein
VLDPHRSIGHKSVQILPVQEAGDTLVVPHPPQPARVGSSPGRYQEGCSQTGPRLDLRRAGRHGPASSYGGAQMQMVIMEPGQDLAPLRIDLLVARLSVNARPHGADPSALDADVGPVGTQPGMPDDKSHRS